MMHTMEAKSRIAASPSTESLGAWRIRSTTAAAAAAAAARAPASSSGGGDNSCSASGAGSPRVASPHTPPPPDQQHPQHHDDQDDQELQSPLAPAAAKAANADANAHADADANAHAHAHAHAHSHAHAHAHANAAKAAAAPRPIPGGLVMRVVYAAAGLVISRDEIAALFDDDVLPDAEDEEEAGEAAAKAAPGGASGDDSSGSSIALRQRGPRQQGQQQEQQQQQQDGSAAAKDDEASVRERVRLVRQALAEAGDAVRRENPLIYSARNQDAVGLGVLAGASLALVALFSLFALGLAPWFAVVPCAAFLTSLLHELEHDLIHQLYFRGRRLSLPFFGSPSPSSSSSFGVSAIDAALAVCYAFRPSTISPWARRALHLHHHRASGSGSDLEERSITSGMPWGVLRLVATGDNLLAILLRPHATLAELRAYIRAQPVAVKADPGARLGLVATNALGYFPLGTAHYALWWTFLAVGAGSLATGLAPQALVASAALAALGADAAAAAAAAASLWPLLRFYGVAFGAPQFLRTFCLHAVSSNVHYYKGGRKAHGLIDQCQIVDSPLFWPLQLFCFNFGATHALHHFLPSQTFYLRQAVAGRVRPSLVSAGVRVNDLGTVARANRLPPRAARRA